MFGKKITSKDQLIKDLADEFDSCFDQSYPVVDLTDQIVATVMDCERLAAWTRSGFH